MAKSRCATELAEYATAVINALQDAPHGTAPPDPPVVVVAEPELFDVGLRADIATTHSGLVDRMVTELARQDGVASVQRDAHDALGVNAPDWGADNPQRWLQAWFGTGPLALPEHNTSLLRPCRHTVSTPATAPH